MNGPFACCQRPEIPGTSVHRDRRGRLDAAREDRIPQIEDHVMTNTRGPARAISQEAANALATAQRLAADLPKAARRKVGKLESKLSAAGEQEAKRRRQLAKAAGRPKREQRRRKQLDKAVGRVAGLVGQIAEAVGDRLPTPSTDGRAPAKATRSGGTAASKATAATKAGSSTRPATPRKSAASSKPTASTKTAASSKPTASTRTAASTNTTSSTKPAAPKAAASTTNARRTASSTRTTATRRRRSGTTGAPATTKRSSSTRSARSQPRRRSLRPNADEGKQPDG
jgi:hypothetical protein